MDKGVSTTQQDLISGVIEKGICVACGACVGLCPYFMYFDGNITVMDRCTVTKGRCIQVCPRACFESTSPRLEKASQEIYEALGPFRRLIKARAKAAPGGVQYGGVVTSLVCYGMRRGILESAILTDKGGELSPCGKVASSEEDALSCAGSRYSASGSLSALNKAIKEGRKRIAAVGLPCQIEAVERLGRSVPDGAQMASRVALRIGLFCTWALDYRRLREFLQARGIGTVIERYDIPPPPAEKFQVVAGGNTLEFDLKDIRNLVQKGCSLCPDMTAYWADISVGTLEGDERWNTVILRTALGEELFNDAVKDGIIEEGELPEANLRHLTEACLRKRERGTKAQEEFSRG